MKAKKFLLSIGMCMLVLPTLVGCNQEKTYTIEFNKNTDAATGFMQSVESKADEYVRLPKCTFKLDGFSFAGWSENRRSTVVTYKDGARFKMPNNDLRLYAVWENLDRTIHFDLNGGTGTMEDVVVQYGSTYTFPGLGDGCSAPEGLFFAGWCTDKDGNGPIHGDGGFYGPIYEDVTFYAIWDGTHDFAVFIAPQINRSFGCDIILNTDCSSVVEQKIQQEIATYFDEIYGFSYISDRSSPDAVPTLDYLIGDKLVITDTNSHLYIYGKPKKVSVTYHIKDLTFTLEENCFYEFSYYAMYRSDDPCSTALKLYLESHNDILNADESMAEYFGFSQNGEEVVNLYYLYFYSENTYDVYINICHPNIRFEDYYNGRCYNTYGMSDAEARSSYYYGVSFSTDNLDSCMAVWAIRQCLNNHPTYVSFSFTTLDQSSNIIEEGLSSVTLDASIYAVRVCFILE